MPLSLTILLFLVILLVLILVHEFGHFLTAKWFGARVDEFGVGFPPKLYGKKIGETEYTVNALPFGGFVRIFGEDPTEDSEDPKDKGRKFGDISLWKQAVVMVAGVFMNVVLAWVLFSAVFMLGVPATKDAVPEGMKLENPQLAAVRVLPGSPAEQGGLIAGDQFLKLSSGSDVLSNITEENFQSFIASHGGEKVTIKYERGDDIIRATLVPQTGVSGRVENRAIIGIRVETVGTYTLPAHLALWQGLERTAFFTKLTVVGLGTFFGNIIMGDADLDKVAGPVGIVNLVGEYSSLGLVYLFQFIALISISLAVINIIPFPALDGGRLLFLIIEAIKGSPIKPQVVLWVNGAGFALLILLMLVVTYNDIARLVSG